MAAAGQGDNAQALSEASRKKVPFCFTLPVENSQWYIEQVEGIFIRLDQIGPLLPSRFPDFQRGRKARMRDEWSVTEEVRVFNLLAEDPGREVALGLFRCGDGYVLQPTGSLGFTFASFLIVPLLGAGTSPRKPGPLQALADHSAVIPSTPRWFHLYRQTGHLRRRISESSLDDILENRL